MGLTLNDRKEIAKRWAEGESAASIATRLGFATGTIYTELERGKTGKLDRNSRPQYDAARGQAVYQENLRRRGNRRERRKKAYLQTLMEHWPRHPKDTAGNEWLEQKVAAIIEEENQAGGLRDKWRLALVAHLDREEFEQLVFERYRPPSRLAWAMHRRKVSIKSAKGSSSM